MVKYNDQINASEGDVVSFVFKSKNAKEERVVVQEIIQSNTEVVVTGDNSHRLKMLFTNAPEICHISDKEFITKVKEDGFERNWNWKGSLYYHIDKKSEFRNNVTYRGKILKKIHSGNKFPIYFVYEIEVTQISNLEHQIMYCMRSHGIVPSRYKNYKKVDDELCYGHVGINFPEVNEYSNKIPNAVTIDERGKNEFRVYDDAISVSLIRGEEDITNAKCDLCKSVIEDISFCETCFCKIYCSSECCMKHDHDCEGETNQIKLKLFYGITLFAPFILQNWGIFQDLSSLARNIFINDKNYLKLYDEEIIKRYSLYEKRDYDLVYVTFVVDMKTKNIVIENPMIGNVYVEHNLTYDDCEWKPPPNWIKKLKLIKLCFKEMKIHPMFKKELKFQTSDYDFVDVEKKNGEIVHSIVFKNEIKEWAEVIKLFSIAYKHKSGIYLSHMMNSNNDMEVRIGLFRNHSFNIETEEFLSTINSFENEIVLLNRVKDKEELKKARFLESEISKLKIFLKYILRKEGENDISESDDFDPLVKRLFDRLLILKLEGAHYSSTNGGHVALGLSHYSPTTGVLRSISGGLGQTMLYLYLNGKTSCINQVEVEEIITAINFSGSNIKRFEREKKELELYSFIYEHMQQSLISSGIGLVCSLYGDCNKVFIPKYNMVCPLLMKKRCYSFGDKYGGSYHSQKTFQ